MSRKYTLTMGADGFHFSNFLFQINLEHRACACGGLALHGGEFTRVEGGAGCHLVLARKIGAEAPSKLKLAPQGGHVMWGTLEAGAELQLRSLLVPDEAEDPDITED